MVGNIINNTGISPVGSNRNQQGQQVYSIEQYFELENKATFKSEFVDGKIIPMSGGTISHNRIEGMIFLYLALFALDKAYEVLNSNQKIFIPDFNQNVYADTCVVIGEPKMYNNGNQAILNPAIIFEVASKSTEKYDRSKKFMLYKTIPSFKEYVLVNQYMPIVEVFFKINENEWRSKSYIGLEAIVQLETIDITLKMADIYKNVNDLEDPQAYIEFPEKQD